jgi:hypothetical protein
MIFSSVNSGKNRFLDISSTKTRRKMQDGRIKKDMSSWLEDEEGKSLTFILIWHNILIELVI